MIRWRLSLVCSLAVGLACISCTCDARNVKLHYVFIGDEVASSKLTLFFGKRVNGRIIDKHYKITPGVTDTLALDSQYQYMGFTTSGYENATFLPEISDVTDNTEVTIYLYNRPRFNRAEDGSIIFQRASNIDGYFFTVIEDNRVMIYVSIDETITNARLIDYSRSMDVLQEARGGDIKYIDPYSSLRIAGIKDVGGSIPGYIVKNATQKTMLWLN